MQTDWAYLRRGLKTHVALLDALQMDLPAPKKGDYLHRILDTSAIIDRDTVLSAADPMAATQPLIDAIPKLSTELDQASMDVINEHSERVYRMLKQGMPLVTPLLGWTNALRHIEPFLTDAEVKAQVQGLLQVLDAYEGMGC